MRVNAAPLLLSLQLRPHTPVKQEAPLGLLPGVDLEPEASSPEGVIPSHRAGIGSSRLTAATACCCHTVSLLGNTSGRGPQPRWPRPLAGQERGGLLGLFAFPGSSSIQQITKQFFNWVI